MATNEELRSVFARHGMARNGSTLNERLSRGIATRADLAGLLSDAPAHQQRVVLLYAAVHYLLLEQPDVALSRWYPTISGGPLPDGDPIDDFAAFCAAHDTEIRELVRTRTVQTNEVGRSGPLRAALASIGRPLSLVELGASAGLNLQVDQFSVAYRLADRIEMAGPADSNVHLECDCTRGAHPETGPLVVTGRVGIDLDPIDVTDPSTVRWLEACVWGDEPERFARVAAAAELARRRPARIVKGDVVEVLEQVVAGAADGHLCLFDTWVLAYLSVDHRRALVERVDELGRHRDLDWIVYEQEPEIEGIPVPPTPGNQSCTLTKFSYREGIRTATVLATCHHHGRWMQWR